LPSSDQTGRLETIPGIGPITASALAVTVTDPTLFRSGRHLAAWLGLVPRQNSSGGKERLGGISKQGDRYIRRLLISGAHAVLQYAKRGRPGSSWATGLLQRRPFKLVAVALANKTARIAWALLARGETYRSMPEACAT
jgi:transposase